MVDGCATDTPARMTLSPWPQWGQLCEMESCVWSAGPVSALMQKIILSALKGKDKSAAK